MKIYFDYGTGWEDVTRYIRDAIKVTQRAGTDDFHYAQNVCNLTMMMDSSPFVPTTSGMLYYNDSFTSDSEWVVTVSEDTNIYTRGGVRNTTVFNIQSNIKYLVRLELTANQASNISLIGKTSSGTYRIIGNSTMVKGTNIVSFMVESDVQIVELGLVWDSLIPIEITKMYVGDWKWVSNYDKLKNADEVKVKVVDEWNTTNKISVYDKSDFTSDTEWTLTIAEDVLPSTRGGVYNITAINLSANANYLVSVDIYAEKSSNIYFIGKNVSGNWEIIGNSTMVAGWQTVEMQVNNPTAFTNIGFVWDIVSVEFTRITISNIGGKTLFTGIISNKPSIPYDGMYELLQLQLEATDRVRKLEVSPDEIVLRNAKIADYTNKSQSIIHQLACNAGFTNADIADFTINTTISGFATISGSDSILSIMDTLLYENGFVLHMDENDTIKPIQWILPSGTTPVYTFTGRDIFPALEYSENEKEYNKVEVTYYNVGEKPNVLLYKHSVPEDSNGLFTGYPVISGYYYPIEANIINDETGLREEVWFEYQDTSIKALTNKAIVEKLDYDPRTAMKAFKSDYSAIICTSGHYLDYRADAGLDLLSQTFKNNKAQVLFKNNTSESKKIYYLNVYGNVLYKTAERKTTVGEDLTKKKTNAYTSKYVYDSLTAKNLAVGLYQISQNNGTYTFSSFVDVPIGSYVYLNVPRFETYGIVLEKTYDILNGIFNYKIRQWQSVNTQVSTSIISNQDINTTNFLKLSILSRWCAIYDELDVTTVLTDDISHFVQGQYCSTIQSAKNVGVAVSDMQDYIDAVNQLRDYLWNPSTGILKYSTIISDEQSTADTYFATCTSKYNNLLNAINHKVLQSVGVIANLSNDNHTVPTDANGNNGNYTDCSTTMSIYKGGIDDSANWTVSASPSAGITGSLSGRTYTVTNLTADTGYVDLTASRSGYSSITCRFTISKAKQGDVGQNATAYWVVSSAAAVSKSQAGVYTPTSLTFTGKSATGIASPVDYAGRFIIAETTDGSAWTDKYTSSANETSKTYTPSAGIQALRCRLYLAGGTSTLLDEEIIPIVVDGPTGPTGPQGPTGPTGPQGPTGPAGQPAIIANLSNDSHVVPTDANGNNGNYTGCATTMSIFIGSTDDSANWTVSETHSSGVVGSLSGKTYTVTNLTTDTGYVDLTASRTGFDSITLRFSISKVKSGISYYLIATAGAIKRSTDGIYTPSSVTFSAQSITAAGTVLNYSGRFIIAETTDGSSWSDKYTSSADESSKTYTLSAGIKALRCRLYLAGGTTTLLDEETIPIVLDGPQGPQGIQGIDGKSAVYAYLTNDSHTLPCNSDGTVKSYAGSGTQIHVFEGTTALDYDGVGTENGKWKVTATASNITVGSITDGGTYASVADHSGMSSSVDTVTISYAITGKTSGGTNISITLVQTITKAKSSAAYWIVPSAGAIKKSLAGVYTPASITFTAKSDQTGSIADYSGMFIIAESTDGSTFTDKYTSSSNESAKTYTPSAGIALLRCRLYFAGGTTTMLDEETIPVVEDGPQGPQGPDAPRYLGKYYAAHPSSYLNGDWWTVYDTDDSPIQRGVWYSAAGIATRISAVSGETGYTTDPILLAKLASCMADVAWAEKQGTYGTAANYGIAMFFESFGAVTAFIRKLFVQAIYISISAGNEVLTSLPYNYSKAPNTGLSYAPARYYAVDNGTGTILRKSFTLPCSGSVRVFCTFAQYSGETSTVYVRPYRIRNGVATAVGTEHSSGSTTPQTIYDDVEIQEGDSIEIYAKRDSFSSGNGCAVTEFYLGIDTTPGIIRYLIK